MVGQTGADSGHPLKPLAVLIAGDPVQSAMTRRGDFAALVRRAAGGVWSSPWITVDLRTDDMLPDPMQVAGVIVTGSASHLSERTPWMDRGVEYLQRLVAAAIPTLGICFGHQMLGDALGGIVGRNPRGRELGTVALQVSGPSPLLWGPLFSGEPLLTVNASHLDSILRLPSGAEVFATTALEEHALVRFAPRAWGVQFHPEFDAEIVRCYIEERRAALKQEGMDAERLLAQTRDAAPGREVLVNFIERVVRSGVAN